MVRYGEVWAEQLVPGPKLSPLSGSITSLSPPVSWALIPMNLQPAIPQPLSCESTHPRFSKATLRSKLSGFSLLSPTHGTSCSVEYQFELYWILRQRKIVCTYVYLSKSAPRF